MPNVNVLNAKGDKVRDFAFADHAPFVAADIPAVWIWRYPPPHPYYHSSGDTPRWVNFTLLAEDVTRPLGQRGVLGPGIHDDPTRFRGHDFID